MCKFALGDLVVGKDSSNEVYNVTNKRNDFLGRVLDIGERGNIMNIEVIKSRSGACIGLHYWVGVEHFKHAFNNEDTISLLRKRGYNG